MNKLTFAALGVALIASGITICFNPVLDCNLHGDMVDFTGFNVPLGLFHIAVGVLSIWSVFKKRKKDGEAPDDEKEIEL